MDNKYVAPRGTYDPIIINSAKMIHNHIKNVHVEFHRGNPIFNPTIIAKHIFLGVPILDVGAIMDRP